MSSTPMSTNGQKSIVNQWPGRLALTMVAASVVYCGLEFLSLNRVDGAVNLFWLSAFNGQANRVVTAVFWLGLLVLAVVWLRWRFSAGHLLASAAFLVVGGLWLFFNSTSLGTLTWGGHQYYLVENYDWYSKWYSYALYDCAGSNSTCQRQDFYNAYSPIIPLDFSLAANNATMDLEVRLNGNILYVFGPSPRCYEPVNIIGYCARQ